MTHCSGGTAVERAPVEGHARLTLRITVRTKRGMDATDYVVTFLPSHPSVGAPAWRLTKTDGTVYDVIVRGHGPECDCPDFVICRDGRDRKGCKHIAALRAVGLLRSLP